MKERKLEAGSSRGGFITLQMNEVLHLVVLIHGLNGYASDFELLAKCLNYPGIIIFAPECNQGRTGDGIENGGNRIFKSVKRKIEELSPEYISVIGHGIGGLYARVMLKLLVECNAIPNCAPFCFISVGTPHLGNKNPSKIMSFMANLVLDQTGKDLLFLSENDSPFLVEIAKNEYIDALAYFKDLIVYADTNASIITYQSAAISKSNFAADIFSPVGTSSTLSLEAKSLENLQQDAAMDDVEKGILECLCKLEWRRIAYSGNKSVALHSSGFWLTTEAGPVIDNIAATINRHPQSDLVLPTHHGHTKHKYLPDTHLVVLMHGLDGFNTDLKYIAKKLKERFAAPFRTFSPECNHGRTYDGIMNGAMRIVKSIEEEISDGNVKYISFIGHSLGGMYLRCVAGLLYQNGIIPDKITPLNYISLATPHLGSKHHTKILGDKLTTFVVGNVIGKTGKELMLNDSKNEMPLILEMTEEKYLNALRSFRKLIVYSNIKHDAAVHYSTAAIRRRNFTTAKDIRPLSLPAVIIDDYPDEDLSSFSDFESIMLSRLNTLNWHRFAVLPARPLLAHIDIIIKSKSFNESYGYPIVAHLLEQFYNPNSAVARIRPVLPITQSFLENPNGTEHLIVIIHGHDSVSHDLLPLADAIRDRYPSPRYQVIVPSCNDNKTDDGIFMGATRLFVWLQDVITETKARKISFIGESLGGLYARCLVGMLFTSDMIPQVVKPISFITIGSQHLGTRKNISDWLSSKYLRSLMSTTGRDLNFLDREGEDCCLVQMTSPAYLKPLSLFSNLILYANVKPDQYGYFVTSAITTSEIPEDERFSYHQRIFKIANEAPEAPKDSLEGKIISTLGKLNWNKYCIVPPTNSKSGVKHIYWKKDKEHPLIVHIVEHLINA